MDTVKHRCSLHDNPDTLTWQTFSYAYLNNKLIQLKGKWKGTNMDILMKEIPIDSMNLVKKN